MPTTKYDAFPWDFEEDWATDLGPYGPWNRHKVCGSYVMRGGRWVRMDHAKAFVVGPKGDEFNSQGYSECDLCDGRGEVEI